MARKAPGILKLRDPIPWESFHPLLEELTGCATRDWRKGLIAREGSLNDASFEEAPVSATASVHDSLVFKSPLDERDQVMSTLHAQEFLPRKATRGHPLSGKEQKTNHAVSRMRLRVEHIFARMAWMGADFCRSIGLRRATQHNRLCNLVYNMDRYVRLLR